MVGKEGGQRRRDGDWGRVEDRERGREEKIGGRRVENSKETIPNVILPIIGGVIV